ncbi:nitrilase-related carbon-nitrogen hydrolase [Streptomyces sp. NPDC052036]|uniref:nitrilase-related carbon-nitrogen hydrolase n=1 Tax=Streptomyces sp. NPDC052036 TaxID=3155171 RepID=UPI003413B923
MIPYCPYFGFVKAPYALIADGEQIHAAMFPGGLGSEKFAPQMEVAIRQHALESACFVVNATAWLDDDQKAKLVEDNGVPVGLFSHGFFTAIVDPEGRIVGEPLAAGEGEVIADRDFTMIDRRKRMADTRGHYARPELLSLQVDRMPTAPLHERGTAVAAQATRVDEKRSTAAQ